MQLMGAIHGHDRGYVVFIRGCSDSFLGTSWGNEGDVMESMASRIGVLWTALLEKLGLGCDGCP